MRTFECKKSLIFAIAFCIYYQFLNDHHYSFIIIRIQLEKFPFWHIDQYPRQQLWREIQPGRTIFCTFGHFQLDFGWKVGCPHHQQCCQLSKYQDVRIRMCPKNSLWSILPNLAFSLSPSSSGIEWVTTNTGPEGSRGRKRRRRGYEDCGCCRCWCDNEIIWEKGTSRGSGRGATRGYAAGSRG